MVVILDDIVETKGSITIELTNTEYTVIDTTRTVPYIVEAYIDLSSLTTGDTLELTEYIDNKVFSKVSFTGPVAEPVLRLDSKMLPTNTHYKITVNLTQGSTPKSIGFAILEELTRRV